MFKHLVNAPYVLNVLVPFDIFKLHFNGNSPSKFTSMEDDESIYLKPNSGPLRHNKLLLCSLPTPGPVLSSRSSFWTWEYARLGASRGCNLYPEDHAASYWQEVIISLGAQERGKGREAWRTNKIKWPISKKLQNQNREKKNIYNRI